MLHANVFHAISLSRDLPLKMGLSSSKAADEVAPPLLTVHAEGAAQALRAANVQDGPGGALKLFETPVFLKMLTGLPSKWRCCAMLFAVFFPFLKCIYIVYAPICNDMDLLWSILGNSYPQTVGLSKAFEVCHQVSMEHTKWQTN